MWCKIIKGRFSRKSRCRIQLGQRANPEAPPQLTTVSNSWRLCW
nr:MAG TPA: hypothetical protein [Caudoviricetes sp.]